MRTARVLLIGTCGLVGLLLLAGCGPDPKQLQIEAQAEKINQLTAENDDLRSRLTRALRERDEARARVYALEQQVADLRRQLAAKPPIEKGPWEEAGGFAWKALGTDILFDSGKATLKPTARARLQEIVNDINSSYADRLILLVGHTDTDPIKVSGWKDNLDLSVNRSATVFRELMKMGVSPQRMMAAGQGEYVPRAPNDTKANKALNRRVVFMAVPMPPSEGVPSETPAPTTEVGGTGGELKLK